MNNLVFIISGNNCAAGLIWTNFIEKVQNKYPVKWLADTSSYSSDFLHEFWILKLVLEGIGIDKTEKSFWNWKQLE